MRWRLNRVLHPVMNLGPGRRLGIWVQGCSLACPGCVSRDLWPAKGGADVSVERLAHWAADRALALDGVTITGGEPFEQYAQLVAFCTYLRQLADTDITVFTGFRLAELERRHPDRVFTECIDRLVDGRYVASRAAVDGWRGSDNQRLYELRGGRAVRGRGKAWSGTWTIALGAADDVYLAGIPRVEEMGRLRVRMARLGEEADG